MSDALSVRLIGMNSGYMNDYIEYVGDRLLNMLGYEKYFNKKKHNFYYTFPWTNLNFGLVPEEL